MHGKGYFDLIESLLVTKGRVFHMRGKFHSFFIKILLILAGNTIMAIGVSGFILKSNIAIGGTTGTALCLEHFFGLDLSAGVLIINCIMLVIGLIVMGKAFVLTSLISSFYYPVILSIVQRFPLEEATSDMVLLAVFGGALIGIGTGLIFRSASASGGVDILFVALNQKKGLPLASMVYAFDFLVFTIQIAFIPFDQILWGILVAFVSTVLIDKVMILGQNQTQVIIISPQYKAIKDTIHDKLNRGTTLLNAVTGYKGNEQKVVLSIISDRQLVELNSIIMEIDPQAFLIISRVNEVKGEGFSYAANAEQIKRM